MNLFGEMSVTYSTSLKRALKTGVAVSLFTGILTSFIPVFVLATSASAQSSPPPIKEAGQGIYTADGSVQTIYQPYPVPYQDANSLQQGQVTYQQVPQQVIYQQPVMQQQQLQLIPIAQLPAEYQQQAQTQAQVQAQAQQQIQQVQVQQQVPAEFAPVPIPFPVERVRDVSVPTPFPVERVRDVRVPFPITIERVRDVSVPTPFPVERVRDVRVPVPFPVERVRDVNVPTPYPVERVRDVPVPTPFPVERIREVKVPTPYPVERVKIKEVRVPYPVPTHQSAYAAAPSNRKIVNNNYNTITVNVDGQGRQTSSVARPSTRHNSASSKGGYPMWGYARTRVNLRACPTLMCEKRGTAKKGQALLLSTCNNKWCRTTVNRQPVFVSRKYVGVQ